MSISSQIQSITATLPPNVRLVAVSKFNPVSALQEAYDAGQRVFGESKVQEMGEKYELLPKDIEWHFIGHLQSNKVKYIAPYVALIHGVDSFKLLEEINKQGEKSNRKINCLLQVHIAKEETKFGFSEEELTELLKTSAWKEFHHIEIVGLMGMASYVSDLQQVKAEFAGLKTLFDSLKADFFQNSSQFKELSMGMSGDYQLAIEQGSTLVRIGSSIFGERMY